jgi:hypothetical protein
LAASRHDVLIPEILNGLGAGLWFLVALESTRALMYQTSPIEFHQYLKAKCRSVTLSIWL